MTTSKNCYRKILLCVTGLSPQIVTETIYALAQEQNATWIPNQVVLITTAKGANIAKNLLLTSLSTSNKNAIDSLCADWGLPSIQFDETCIKTLQNKAGIVLEDIRDDKDNEQAANYIAHVVGELTRNPNTHIHASIAGGRKTMGFFLGHAMSLFAREHDRLSHVLVSEPYESSRDFLYPTPYSQWITNPRNPTEQIDTSKACVSIGDIPFARLRSILPSSFLQEGNSFADTVAAANTSLSEAKLSINVVTRNIVLNNRSLPLAPLEIGLIMHCNVSQGFSSLKPSPENQGIKTTPRHLLYA